MTKKTNRDAPISITWVANLLGIAELQLQELLIEKTGNEEAILWEEIPPEYMEVVAALAVEAFEKNSRKTKDPLPDTKKERDEPGKPFEIVIDLSKIRTERSVIVKFI